MPKLVKNEPEQVQPQEQVEKPARKVVHEKLTITEYSTTSENGPFYADDAKFMLGWETESQYQRRMGSKYTEEEALAKKFSFKEFGPDRDDCDEIQPIHCTNAGKLVNGKVVKERVVCWYNRNNRYLDKDWCDALTQEILKGNWAGPHTVAGGTVNGETARVSRHGDVLSAQHQWTALVLAQELLDIARAEDGEDRERYPFWHGHDKVFIEIIVITGLSDDPRVLQSIDAVRPRRAEDVLATMPLYRDQNPVARKELTRLLASAIDFLWKRTEAKGYQTHPEIVAFLDRHKRLLKCVEHLFHVNAACKPKDDCSWCKGKGNVRKSPCSRCKGTGKNLDAGRRVSGLHLNPGHCAALMYLMGSGKTDEGEYRKLLPPSEKVLDWGLWDKAKDFWSHLVCYGDFAIVRDALGRLVDSNIASEDNEGLGGRSEEKLALLAAAWHRWKDHPKSGGDAFDSNDLRRGQILCLEYTKFDKDGKELPDKQRRMEEKYLADFGGIDVAKPMKRSELLNAGGPTTTPEPTEEEAEADHEEVEKVMDRTRAANNPMPGESPEQFRKRMARRK